VTSDADARLLAPYRAVRHVSAGDDVPWSGLLVQLASGESRVLVDAAGFDADWAGWRASADGHILAPLDLIRRSDGHSVLLPHCCERVEDFLVRRAARRVPLSAGETVTLGVSLVRGFSAWHATGDAPGEWWLTDGGRPVLACGLGRRDVIRHTAELLRALADGGPGSSALAFAAEALTAERVSTHDLQDAEDALFGVATAEPLATSLLGPRSAREVVASGRAALPAPHPARTTELAEGVRRPSVIDSLAQHVDADLADAVSRATTGLWRRLMAPGEGRRRPWVLAGSAASVVLAAGLLWPTGAGGPATADVVSQGGAGDGSGSTPAPGDTPATGSAVAEGWSEASRQPADLAATAGSLLDARLACAGDESCLAAVSVDPAAAFASGAIDLPAPERQVTLLDDFGGVAVLRVDSLAKTAGSQLVVIMLHDDRWLLRDVHVAKQP
jgi:hypothetical protein